MLIKALGNNILAFLKKHFLPYLVKQAPVEENGVTLVLDEGVDRQADRPTLYKRCLNLTGSDLINYSVTEKTNQNDYTYVAWIKDIKATGFPSLIKKHQYIDPNYNSRFGFEISQQYAYCYSGTTSANTEWDLSSLDLTGWHFVVCRYNSSDVGAEGRLWIDGVEIASNSYLGNVVSNVTYNTITIGAQYNGGSTPTNYWQGKIKYIASYDYAIDESICSSTNLTDFPTDYEINGVFEESEAGGTVTTVYSNNGETGTITTGDITAVRVTQDNAPLLPNSGDVVGFIQYYDVFDANNDFSISNDLDTRNVPFINGGGLSNLIEQIATNNVTATVINGKINLNLTVDGYYQYIMRFGTGAFGLSGAEQSDVVAAYNKRIPTGTRVQITVTVADKGSWNRWYVQEGSLVIGYQFGAGTVTTEHTWSNDSNGLQLRVRTDSGYVASGANPFIIEQVRVEIISQFPNSVGLDETDWKSKISYNTRKDFPLTPKDEPCFEFTSTTTEYFQSPTSLTGVTIIAVYGTTNSISDFTVDSVNNRIYAGSIGVSVARIDLSNGDKIEYLGENSLILLDKGSNSNNYTITSPSITANQATQNLYSSRLKDGWTNDGWTNDIKPITHSSHTVQPGGPDNLTIVKNSEYSFTVSGVASGATRTEGSFWLQQVFLSPWRTAGNYEDWEIDIRIRNTGSRGMYVNITAGSIPLKPTTTKGAYVEDTRFTYQSAPFNERFLVPTSINTWTNVTLTSLHKSARNDSTHFMTHSYFTEDGLVLDDTISIEIEILAIRAKFGGERVDLQLNAPASLNTPTEDIFGNLLQYEGGKLQQDLKVSLPEYKAHHTFGESNEDLYREVSGVKDRLLTPISYSHSDKGFPAIKFNGELQEYFLPTPIALANADIHKFEVYFATVDIDSKTRTAFGRGLSDNHHLVSLYYTNNNYYIGGSNGWVTKSDSEIDLNSYDNLIISYEIDYNNARATVVVKTASGEQLINEDATWFASSAPANFDLNSIGGTLQQSNIRRQIKGVFPWFKRYKNGTLENYWTYTGDNSFLLQDKIGGNHATLTTPDVTANQGTQNVFNPLVDGQSIKTYYWNGVNRQRLELLATKIDVTDEYWEIRFKPSSYGVLLSYGSAYYALILIDGRVQYYSSASTPQAHITVATLNFDEWNVIRFTKTVAGHNITVNGVTESFNSITSMWFRDIGSSLQDCFTGIVDYVDAGTNGYWQNDNDFIDEVGSTDGVNDASYLVDTLIPLPQHPYNGLDIFDNTLTTPRTKERTKSLKYTDND